MKILFIPNWKVVNSEEDIPSVQAPDKYVKGENYWFFRHFKNNVKLDVLDKTSFFILDKIEAKIKFYIWQPIKAFIRRNEYDFVISHGAQSGLVYELLTSFFYTKSKHIMFDIGGLNGSRINKFETPLIRFALRKKPRIIIHSSRQISLYEAAYKFLVPNVHFIPFGVDIEYFLRDPEAVAMGDFYLSFGAAKRDYDTLLNAWDKACLKSKLTIVGQELKQQRENVIAFSKCLLPDLIRYIEQARVVIVPLPCYNYSYGQMTFLQSMVMGKVLIVTKTVSSLDYLSSAPGVFLVDPYDDNDMARALNCVAELDELSLNQLGRANQEFVKYNFSEFKMASLVEQLLLNELDTYESTLNK